MNLFESRDNTIVLPLSKRDGSYLDPMTVTDAEYAIFSKCYGQILFQASLSGGGITIVSLGADKALQVDIPSTVQICGQVPNELKVLEDGKWRGVTLQFGKINFIQTGF